MNLSQALIELDNNTRSFLITIEKETEYDCYPSMTLTCDFDGTCIVREVEDCMQDELVAMIKNYLNPPVVLTPMPKVTALPVLQNRQELVLDATDYPILSAYPILGE
jgi:hypothetical protein